MIDQHVGGQPSHGCKVYHHIQGNCSLYHTLGGIKVAAQPFIHVHTHQCNGDDHGCREIANEADYPSSAAATEPTQSREQRAMGTSTVYAVCTARAGNWLTLGAVQRQGQWPRGRWIRVLPLAT